RERRPNRSSYRTCRRTSGSRPMESVLFSSPQRVTENSSLDDICILVSVASLTGLVPEVICQRAERRLGRPVGAVANVNPKFFLFEEFICLSRSWERDERVVVEIVLASPPIRRRAAPAPRFRKIRQTGAALLWRARAPQERLVPQSLVSA